MNYNLKKEILDVSNLKKFPLSGGQILSRDGVKSWS